MLIIVLNIIVFIYLLETVASDHKLIAVLWAFDF